MAHMKLVSEFKFDTEFPRDHIVCTLNFNSTGPEPDWTNIASDLLTVWDDIWFTQAGTIPMRCKVYDNEGTPPVFPAATALRNWSGVAASSASFRERALCLSYYADQNTPRRRGRVYLPMNLAPGASVAVSGTDMTKALSMATAFANLGGLDIDWEVWSPTSGAGMSVTNAWVDNEWDVQRRRGLRATTRQTAAVGP